MAVAHTLAALGSGRYKKEGWGADAESEDEDESDPSVIAEKQQQKKKERKQRKAAVAQAAHRERQSCHCCRSSKLTHQVTQGLSCGTGPGAVAVHHALVYCVGWSVVIAIRLHFFPRVFMCFTPVWPALPFCDAEPDLFGYNATATSTTDLLTGNATELGGGYWVRGPPGLAGIFDDQTLTGAQAPDPAFLCWLWSRLRLFHLPALACLQAEGGSWLPTLFAASCIGFFLVCLAWIGDLFWVGPTALLYLDGKEKRLVKFGQGKGARTGWRVFALGTIALLLFGVTMSSWSVGDFSRP